MAIRLPSALPLAATALLAAAIVTLPGVALAQDGADQARAVAACMHEHDTQVQRLLRLLEAAERRAAQTDLAADVRRDAVATVSALVDRIRSHAAQLRQCLDAHPIAVRVDERVEETAPTDATHERLAADRGTVHEIERDAPLAAGVHVVRGERVDGSGRAPDPSVRAAVRGVGSRWAACYDQYLDRAARRSGEVHLTFTAGDGGRVGQAQVERVGGFDTGMRQCIERAAVDMRVSGQRGRSVYAYVLRFGD